jgi:hypothetical protein
MSYGLFSPIVKGFPFVPIEPNSLAMPALFQGEVQAAPNLLFDQDTLALRAQVGMAALGDVKRRSLARYFGQRFPVMLKPGFVFGGRDPMTFTDLAEM